MVEGHQDANMCKNSGPLIGCLPGSILEENTRVLARGVVVVAAAAAVMKGLYEAK